MWRLRFFCSTKPLPWHSGNGHRNVCRDASVSLLCFRWMWAASSFDVVVVWPQISHVGGWKVLLCAWRSENVANELSGPDGHMLQK